MNESSQMTDGFRRRGTDVSRVEGFSDGVFAFALTLLVVSLEVPRSFGELLRMMNGFLAFAVCFAMMIMIWHGHYKFFRRFGMHDTTTIILNAVLLFVVLFYVYPLKFVFTVLLGNILHIGQPMTQEFAVNAGEPSTVMAIYSLGYVSVFAVFSLLYVHAFRKRKDLDLSPREEFDTRTQLGEYLVHVSIGLLSVTVALLGGDRFMGAAGFSYFLIGPALTVYYVVAGRRRRGRFPIG